MSSVLTIEHLEEWRARSYEAGSHALTNRRPGVTQGAIEAAFRAADLHAPEEALVWWGWHDGVGEGESSAFTGVGPDIWLHSIAVALGRRRLMADVARTVVPDDPGQLWLDPWLPIAGGQGGREITVDCVGGSGDAAPVFAVEFGYLHPDDDGVRVDSLGDLIGGWIDAIERGVWTFDRHAGFWVNHPDLMTDTQQRSEIY